MPKQQKRNRRMLKVILQNDTRQGISIRLDNNSRYPQEAFDNMSVGEEISYMGNSVRAAQSDIYADK